MHLLTDIRTENNLANKVGSDPFKYEKGRFCYIYSRLLRCQLFIKVSTATIRAVTDEIIDEVMLWKRPLDRHSRNDSSLL